jgi:carbamoyltransferase
LYSALTFFVGFKVNSGEYKLMGLAPHGRPIYRERMLEELIELKADGSFRLNSSYFAYGYDDVMTSPKMNALLDGPPRTPESPITQRERDIAASIQSVTELVVLRMAAYAHELTGSKRLVLAGGVALNCVANARVRREGPFTDVWVQPGAGDSGAALGCALFAWHQLLEQPRPAPATDALRGTYLGPAYNELEVTRQLERYGARFTPYDEARLCSRVAALLADGLVVGHFAGRMEFGPRALGNRSILADPRSPDMQARLNAKIKFRESFRPFAPVVTREDAPDYFEVAANDANDYMQFTVPVRQDAALPAITHVDGSARVQAVDREHNPRLHRLLEAWKAQTGSAVLVNTSFNVRGEPIVASPSDAYRCFMHSGLDALVIENFLLLKAEQPTDRLPPAPRIEPD